MASNGHSRSRRTPELREVTFVDHASRELWASIIGKKVNLVPYSTATSEYRREVEDKIRQRYEITGPLAFLHVNLIDDQSESLSPLRIRVLQEGENFVIEGWGAVAIANSIGYLSELLDPISIVLGLTRRNMMQKSLNYLLSGQGEVGLLVYSILVRHWVFANRTASHPLIFLMSQ